MHYEALAYWREGPGHSLLKISLKILFTDSPGVKVDHEQRGGRIQSFARRLSFLQHKTDKDCDMHQQQHEQWQLLMPRKQATYPPGWGTLQQHNTSVSSERACEGGKFVACAKSVSLSPHIVVPLNACFFHEFCQETAVR